MESIILIKHESTLLWMPNVMQLDCLYIVIILL